jgi:hypothetical protein
MVLCFIHAKFSMFLMPLLTRSQSYFMTDGRSVSQSVKMSWCWVHSGTCDLILLPVGRLLSETCSLVSVGRPFWREDRSAACSSITQWSETRRIRNHTLLSSATPPTWRARFPYLYPPWTRRPGYTPGQLFCMVCAVLGLYTFSIYFTKLCSLSSVFIYSDSKSFNGTA